MKKHYMEIIKACDKAVGRLMTVTITDKNHPHYGGVLNKKEGYVTPGASIGCMLTYTPAYYNEHSEFYKDDELLMYMNRAIEYTLDIQREDGTIDLLISNFYSAPDTGFMMHNIGRVYKIMEANAKTDKELAVKAKLLTLIQKAGEGLRDGGFHTPNHRWVEAAGLAIAYNITKDESFKKMALMYLAEGIDIDENGEFTERSPGIYNAVNDNALMILAEELDKPELAEHAAKNLEMMFCYFEPDGSVFTQNSVRVDKGEGMPGKSFYPTNYYHIYLKAAFLNNNPRFAKMADLIFESAKKGAAGVPGNLWLYMTVNGLSDYEPMLEEISDEFEVFFKPSNIVRSRKGDFGVTLLGESPNFLFVQIGRLRCYVRMCASFFAVAQFKASEITKTTKGYSMEFTSSGRYKWPFETPPKTNVWEEMDHASRKSVNEVSLKFTVDFQINEKSVLLDVKTEGCDRVPLKLEFCFTGGCDVEGPGFMVDGKAGNSIIVGEGNVTASLGLNEITVGPGFADHKYAASMRGSEPKSNNDFTVYFTGFSNIEKTIEISAK